MDKQPKIEFTPPEITVSVNGTDALRYIKRFGAGRKAMEFSIISLARTLYGEVVRRTPGLNIKKDWRIQYVRRQSFFGEGALTEIRIVNDPKNNDVIIFLEEGTNPHMIFAVNYEYMRFYWDVAGKTILAKEVAHPGTKPYHPMSDAVKFVESQMNSAAKIMEDRFEKTVNV